MKAKAAKLMKSYQKSIIADTLQNIENDPNSSGNVITYDELWFFQYGPKTKQPSMLWMSSRSLKQNKARMSKSQFKTIIGFFDIYRIVRVWLGARRSEC